MKEAAPYVFQPKPKFWVRRKTYPTRKPYSPQKIIEKRPAPKFFNLNSTWVRRKTCTRLNSTRLKNNESRLAPTFFNLNPKFWVR
jgi:hypothetical protein